MRLLVINPKISESVSDLIGAEAQRAASPGTEITMLTAPFGVAYIETRFEALIDAYAAANLVAEHAHGHDAVIVAAFGAVQSDHAARLSELCAGVVEEDGADAIILGGAPLVGLARSIAGEIPVPVVDGVSSAVKHAEALVGLKAGAARAGSFAPPPRKANAGLPEPLRELLRRAAG